MVQVKHVNDKAYSALHSPLFPKVSLTLGVALDVVPGWGHKVQDHIDLIFRNDPYVLSVTVNQADSQPTQPPSKQHHSYSMKEWQMLTRALHLHIVRVQSESKSREEHKAWLDLEQKIHDEISVIEGDRAIASAVLVDV